VALSLVGMKCAILLNRSTTTMMALKPLDGDKFTMKSMDTLSHGPSGMGNGRNNPACFLLSVQFCWQVKQVFTYSLASSSSWANSRTFWGMWWCTLHHHGPEGAHHDIPSKAHPLTSLLEHRADFTYTLLEILGFATVACN
jgi:hypothetical protein